MNQLKSILHRKLKEEIAILPISQATKEKLEKTVLGSLSFYTYLPLDILRTTPNEECYVERTLDLSIYAILYVASVVCTDKLFDQQISAPNNSKLIVEYIFFIKEHAIRGLQKTLGDNSNFWTSFDALKMRLFAYSKSTNQEFKGDEEELLSHLLKKSSLIEAYIISMKIIVHEELKWDLIQKALIKFHIAFQLVDDYEDMYEDAKIDQLNYFLYMGKSLFDADYDNIYSIKLLYKECIVERGLRRALSFAKEASEGFLSQKMDNSKCCANILHNQIGRMLVEIKLLKEKAVIKSELSDRKMSQNNINLSIDKSLSFIKMRKNSDNSWSDFMTLAGTGTNWITAFVISMLGEFPENKDYLQDSMIWLEKQGGKYNNDVIIDADSTNFLIRAKSIMNGDVHASDLQKWIQFRHPSGGFSTYIGNGINKVLHVNPYSDTKGWTSEQYCVTAVACWIAKMSNNEDVYRKSLSFLRNGVKLDGSLPSYWWTEDLYATAFAVMSGLDQKPLDYLLSRQTKEGFWTNMNKPSVFYTALSIKALESVSGDDKSIKEHIARGIKWLLCQQNEDGSWDSENILRIPAPEILDPQKIIKWRKSSFGVNIITDNYQRVFTTALSYNILLTFSKYVA